MNNNLFLFLGKFTDFIVQKQIFSAKRKLTFWSLYLEKNMPSMNNQKKNLDIFNKYSTNSKRVKSPFCELGI